MLRSIFIWTGLVTVSTAVIVVLYMAAFHRPGQQNGFVRRPPQTLQPYAQLDIGYPSYYLAGADSHAVYLGHPRAPAVIIRIEVATRDTQHVRIRHADQQPVIWQHVRVHVDPPWFYLVDGITQVMIKGSLATGAVLDTMETGEGFYDACPLTSTSFILSRYHAVRAVRDLVKWPVDGREPLLPPILTKQVDGKFCTDGMMIVNRTANTAAYVYYYRNEFVLLDTQLHVRLLANTVDTTAHAKFSLSTIYQGSAVTFTSPPLEVNQHAYLSDTHLYIHSALKADNEASSTFRQHDVVDAYALATGRYQHSLYVPLQDGKHLSGGAVIKNTLVTLHRDRLLFYTLRG